MVTAKEAKKILLEQRRRNRERQKEHMEKMRAQGYRRIAILISGEAYKALERAVKNQDRTKSELVTEALISAFGDDKIKISIPRGTNISTNDSVPRGTFDKTAALGRIMELHVQGSSNKEIAEQLDAEGIPTARGGKWHRGTIGKMISRAKEEQS
jgi:hypothetical protein